MQGPRPSCEKPKRGSGVPSLAIFFPGPSTGESRFTHVIRMFDNSPCYPSHLLHTIAINVSTHNLSDNCLPHSSWKTTIDHYILEIYFNF